MDNQLQNNKFESISRLEKIAFLEDQEEMAKIHKIYNFMNIFIKLLSV